MLNYLIIIKVNIIRIQERNIKGVFEIQLEPHKDKRGFFMRVYDSEEFKKHKINKNWVQENHSLSKDRGVLRGLHFQLPPHTETKLVRVVKGKILDVFVDLRKESKTFGDWDSIILSARNKKMIYIPKGFAHGFCTLTNNCEVVYKVDNNYNPDSERTLIWNDLTLEIDWPTENPIISEKDSNAKSFKEFITEYKSLDV